MAWLLAWRSTCSGNNSFVLMYLLDAGQCIDTSDMCDGLPNCDDESDELVKYCASIDCPLFAFRCGNGACITTKSKCDGQVNCIDGK